MQFSKTSATRTFTTPRPDEFIEIFVAVIERELLAEGYVVRGKDEDTPACLPAYADRRRQVAQLSFAIRLARVVDVAREIFARRAIYRPLCINLKKVAGLQRIGIRCGNTRASILRDEISSRYGAARKKTPPEAWPRFTY